MKKIILFGVGGFLSLFFVGQNALAYDQNNTHPALTDEAVDLYNLYFPDQPLSQKEKELMIKGAVEEDFGKRPMNHFYDPVHNRGWMGSRSSKVWAKSSKEQQERKSLYATSGILAGRATDDDPADFSYERALLDYARGDRERAFKAFGHVMHLLEDANVPEHTRNDTHLSVHHSTGSPYETAMAKWSPKNFHVAEGLFRKNQNPVLLNTLEEYFDSIAHYSNGYFFSEDTIFSAKYANPLVDFWKVEILDGELFTVGYKVHENQNYRLVKKLNKNSTRNLTEQMAYTLNDKIILDGYWDRLSKDFVLHGAGAIKMFLDQAEEVKKQYEAEMAKRQKLSGNFFQKLTGAVKEAFKDNSPGGQGIILVQKTLAVIEKPEPKPKVASHTLQTPYPAVLPLSDESAQVTSLPVSNVQLNSSGEENKKSENVTVVKSETAFILGGNGVESTPSPAPTPTPYPTPSPSATPTLSPTPTPTPLPTPLATPTPSPTPSPSATPTPTPTPSPTPTPAAGVVINEIAWMGTQKSANDEWIELYNSSSGEIGLDGWTLVTGDGSPSITLSASVSAHGFYLLERPNDQTVADIGANQTYTGALNNSGEILELRDQNGNLRDLVSKSSDGGWYAGSNTDKSSMERINPAVSGSDQTNWGTNTASKRNGTDRGGNPIFGTPGRHNSVYRGQSPQAVTGLAVDPVTTGNLITLSWIVPSDPDSPATDLSYDLRYATKSFSSEDDWNQAVSVDNLPAVGESGQSVLASFKIPDFNKEYFFNLKTKDSEGNYSPFSNTPFYTIPSAISNSGWPMAGINPHHTLKTTFLGPFQPTATKSWEFSLPSNASLNQPVVGPDGRIYFGTNEAVLPRFYAISESGAELWKYGVENGAPSTPVVFSDNSVAYGYLDFGIKLTSRDKNGVMQWEVVVGDRVDQILGAPDGTMYLSSENGKLTAIKSNGGLKWQITKGEIGNLAPVILDDGNLYATGVDVGVPSFYSFDGQTGATLWSKRLTNNCLCGVSNPSYDSASSSLYAAANFYILKSDLSGSVLEDIVLNDVTASVNITTMVSIGQENLLVGLDFSRANPASASSVWAVRKSDRQVVWKYNVDSVVNSQITLDSQENAYFTTRSGKVYSLNANGGLNWMMDFGSINYSSPALSKGSLYVTDENKLIKISVP